MSGILEELDELVVDWNDLEGASKVTRAFLRRLAGDRVALGNLLRRVPDDEQLFSKCERHELLDYIVLHDALDRGFRLRLHVSTDTHLDRPHDHRFSFTSLILCGSYWHTWFRPSRPIHSSQQQEELTRQWMDKRHVDPRGRLRMADLTPSLCRQEAAGSTYTLHHSVLHTTHTTPNTVSLFIRGPVEKRRSVIMDAETDTLWWRHGAEDEQPERRANKRMKLDEVRELSERVERLNVVAS